MPSPEIETQTELDKIAASSWTRQAPRAVI
jgi:hypothetical protein